MYNQVYDSAYKSSEDELHHKLVLGLQKQTRSGKSVINISAQPHKSIKQSIATQFADLFMRTNILSNQIFVGNLLPNIQKEIELQLVCNPNLKRKQMIAYRKKTI